jgi:predicted amidophosphoribosyltransferase
LRPHKVNRAVPGFAAADYQGVALDLVHQFKRSGSGAITNFLARPMASLVASQANAGDKVLLMPVPSRPDSFRRRGFVPAKLLAVEVSKTLRREHSILARVFDVAQLSRGVRDQAILNKLQRQENLHGAMSIRASSTGARATTIDGLKPHLVLLDDVVTTGATLGELARAAVDSGLKPKYFVTFAETL